MFGLNWLSRYIEGSLAQWTAGTGAEAESGTLATPQPFDGESLEGDSEREAPQPLEGAVA
jgi:hypothetical protein